MSLQARRRKDAHGHGAECGERGPTDIPAPGAPLFHTGPALPGLPQGAPGCPREPQGASGSPRVPQTRESKSGPCPGPESRGGSRVWGVGVSMTGKQNADAPPDPLPKVRGQWEPRSAGTHGAARQPFRVSRYKGAVAIRPRMFSVYWGEAGGKDGVTRGGNEESPVSPPSLTLPVPGVPRAGGVRAAALHRGLSGERSRQAAIPAPTPESGRKSLSFQQRLMHQTSIFRTIELVIFFLLN